jgi:hypothetical protein
VILLAQAVKHGYRWVVGDGTKVRFWEDTWFGSAPLTVQFWKLYCVCNKKTRYMLELWVDGELRLIFRRTFSYQMMQSWDDLLSVVENVSLSEEYDALVWCYESSGIYSSHSFYAIVNYRGIKPVYVPAIWNVTVPPRVQLFLWLLSHNRLAIADNLNKKGINKPVQCCFCSEAESVFLLFFNCTIAKSVWDMVGEFIGKGIGADYVLVASKWLQKEKLYGTSIITIVVLRSIWLIRNDIIFNNQVWVDVKMILRRMLKLTLE